MKLLVIGYGNPLRGDDGFGYRAAERIPGAMAVHQLTPELMDAIAQADRVIFLDAAAEGAPGEIRRRPVAPSVESIAFTHHATPGSLLAGALALYGRAPEAEIITVSGADFSLSFGLSAPVAAALEEVLRVISALISYADRRLTSDRNSSRVSFRSRKAPNIALVVAPECCFSTPRIIMQKCRASQITPTPTGSVTS